MVEICTRFRYCCIARRRPVAPGERLWLKRYSHAVYTAVYSPLQDSSKSQALGTSLSWEALGRKLLTAVGCAVASRSPPSTSSITRYTSGFHNLILLSSRASYRRRCELALTMFLSCAPIVLVTFNACLPTNTRTWFLLRVNKTMKHRRTYGFFCFPFEATEEYVSPSEKSISRF